MSKPSQKSGWGRFFFWLMVALAALLALGVLLLALGLMGAALPDPTAVAL